MDFEGHRFKIIRFLSHFLESWNPVSKAVNKSAWCVLVGFPADKPCSCPTPAVQQAPWHSCYLGSLLPSRVTIFFERLNIFLKYLGSFVLLLQTVCNEMLQSMSPAAGQSGCTVSIQNPLPPSKGIALHLQVYSKSSLALPPKQSTG